MDRVSIEQMYAGREFQVEGADTKKAPEEKLLVLSCKVNVSLESNLEPGTQ